MKVDGRNISDADRIRLMLQIEHEEWHAQDICPASSPVEAQARPSVSQTLAEADHDFAGCEEGDCAGPDYQAFFRRLHGETELAPVALMRRQAG
jgi:hypothetical protein